MLFVVRVIILISGYLIYSCVVSYYCYRFALILIKLEDTVDASLDVLDDVHNSFKEILEIPVFFDSMEIRKCVDLIKKSKDVIQSIILDISDTMLTETSDNLKETGTNNTKENEGIVTNEGKEKVSKE